MHLHMKILILHLLLQNFLIAKLPIKLLSFSDQSQNSIDLFRLFRKTIDS